MRRFFLELTDIGQPRIPLRLEQRTSLRKRRNKPKTKKQTGSTRMEKTNALQNRSHIKLRTYLMNLPYYELARLNRATWHKGKESEWPDAVTHLPYSNTQIIGCAMARSIETSRMRGNVS